MPQLRRRGMRHGSRPGLLRRLHAPVNYKRAGEAIQAAHRLDRLAVGEPRKVVAFADEIAADADLAATVLVSLAYLSASRGAQLGENSPLLACDRGDKRSASA